MKVNGFTQTFVIDQGAVLGSDQLFSALYHQPLSDPKRGGICTGLSMIWAARMMMFHDETPQQRYSALRGSAGFRWGGKTQDIHLKAGVSGGDVEDTLRNMYKDALKAYVLRISWGSVVGNSYNDSASMAATVAPGAKKSHHYMLWNVGLDTGSGDAGHMVASYASSGKLGFNRHLYFFDPNLGEYKIKVDETAAFFAAWLDAYATMFHGINYLYGFRIQR